MSLQQTVRAEMIVYFRHLISRVDKHVRAVPRDKVFVKPFKYGNSLGHLLLHLAGNMNHYIGAGIAGTGYVRNRPLEFTDPNPPPPEDALARMHAAADMVVKTLEAQSEEDWSKPITKENHPINTRFGMFLVVISHVNNHIGQMAWMVQAMGYSTNEPPVW